MSPGIPGVSSMSDRPRSLFESLLPPEKQEALARGENVTITSEEVKRFKIAYDQARDHEVSELRQTVARLQAGPNQNNSDGRVSQ